jgi:surface protein
MFQQASAFNQNIGGWNVSNVVSMIQMFYISPFNNGGSSSISAWNVGNLTNMNLMFYGTPFNQPIGSWNVSNVVSMNQTFAGGASFNQNIGSWVVTKVTDFTGTFQNSTVFNNGLSSGASGTLPWTINTTSNVVMTSTFAGNTAFNQNINSWNFSKVTTTLSMFSGANKFNNGLASGVAGNMLLDLSSVTNTTSMFQSATVFNQNLGALNLPVCTSFISMFNGASNFNNGGSSDINNWVLKTTGTIDMTSMFQSAVSFNQPLNNWNTVVVTSMDLMFRGCTAFNNGLASGVAGTLTWNTSSVTTMASTFMQASSFNQNIGAWNVSKVVRFDIGDFTGMFLSATSFNNGGSPDINNWVINTAAPVSMYGMFRAAIAFNQPIGSWNTSRVINMTQMFYQCSAFNQNIGAWNTSLVTTMTYMFFNARSFNNGGSSTINNWNTVSVTNMSFMFSRDTSNGGNSSFNQPIGSWNVSSVTNMNGMFGSVSFSDVFNQDIGSWNISNVTNFVNFMLGKTPLTFSASNLDAIYNGWSTRPVKTPITINFGSAKYTAGSTEGRALLSRTLGTKAITGAVNNGSGLIRITSTAHGLNTGNKILISGIVGTTEANNAFNVTVINANTLDLQGSTFTNTYISGGTIQVGNGWVITDGGI